MLWAAICTPAMAADLTPGQQKLLKDAQTYMGQVQANLKLAQETAAGRLSPSRANLAFSRIDSTKGSLAQVKSRLVELPASHPDVAALQREHDDAGKALEELEALLTGGKEDGPRESPVAVHHDTLNLETARLRELAKMFADPNVLTENREMAAAIVRESQAASAEHDRLVKSYADLIRQQTPEGKQLESASEYFQEKWSAFSAALAKQKETLQAQIEADITGAQAAAEEAVAKEKPLLFSSIVSRQMSLAEEKLVLLEAIDPTEAAFIKERVANARQAVGRLPERLKDAIIATNGLPADLYSGLDREQLASIAKDAWSKVQPDAKVLDIRIPSRDWNRAVYWRHQTDSWYKIDRSRLQVQLVVAHDDKLAVVRPVNLWKNHLEKDAISAFPFHEKGAGLSPQDFLLLGKVK